MNTATIFKKPKFIVLFAVICTFLWGSAFPFVKTGYKLMSIESGDISSTILFAGVRFLTAGIITLIICRLFKLDKNIITTKAFFSSYGNKKFITSCIILSLFMTSLQYTCFYIGLSNASGVNGSIINSSGTIFTVILAFIVYKSDKPTLIKLLGCLLSFIGILAINFRTVDLNAVHSLSDLGRNAGLEIFTMQGEGLLFFASLSAAVGTIFNKNYTQTYNPITLTGFQLAFGGLCLTIIGLLTGGSLNFSGVKAVLVLIYLSILSAIAITLWSTLLKYNNASKVSVFKFLTPIFGVLLSGLILRENILNIWVGISLLLTCAGIVLMQRK
ncbi:MAG: DMT family transporter [Lachnospiraceae bacterium]|nr:DMT family transporter [Lachnospiraceae bacterium]